MTAQQADDAAYQAAMQRNAAALYPQDVAEFRSNWGSETVTVSWIRETVNALTDDRIQALSEAMRGILVTGKGDIPDLWRLAAQEMGVL